MKRRNRFRKWVMGMLVICMAAKAALSSRAEVSSPLPYLKAATYVSDAWVINFWNTESDHMDEEMAQIAADGFNSIVLVIPWREFQPSVNPVSYNDYAFQKLDRVMREAEAHGLWVSVRVSYTWDYYGDEDARNRFFQMLGGGKVRDAWLRYVEKIYSVCSAHTNFYGGFITWEDFWNYTEDVSSFGDGERSVKEAQRIGYQDYLRDHLDLEMVSSHYQNAQPFTDFDEVPIPSRESPAYRFFYDFYDKMLMELLQDAQQVFPNLSMEVRLDVDPVNGMAGNKVGAHHFQTFPCGSSSYTSLMYSISMGQKNQGERITASQAIREMNEQLSLVKMYNDGKPIFIDQLLYMDATEEFSHNAQLYDHERNPYLMALPPVLRGYTNGYAVWSYRNYTNNPVYNCQFALGEYGWDTSRASVRIYNGSSQMFLQSGGKITQQIGSRISGKRTHDNMVRFTAESTQPVTVSVTLGQQTKEVQVMGAGTFELDFGRHEYDLITFRTNGDVYLDNIDVYNFIQDGQLYDIYGNELSCLDAMRRLNDMMN